MPGRRLPRMVPRLACRCRSLRRALRQSPSWIPSNATGRDAWSGSNGHIGDAGKWRSPSPPSRGYFNISTLREPYRVEGMKSMGFELAEQLGWRLPDAVVYPTGGGEGTDWYLESHCRNAGGRLVGGRTQNSRSLLWRRPRDVRRSPAHLPLVPTAPIRGLIQSPMPLGCVSQRPRRPAFAPYSPRDQGGTALAVERNGNCRLGENSGDSTGIDAAPEGGCGLAVLRDSVMQGTVSPDAESWFSSTREAVRRIAFSRLGRFA